MTPVLRLLVLAATLAVPAAASTLEVVVEDTQGRPRPRISVSLTMPSVQARSELLDTDNDGRVVFRNIAPGRYTVRLWDLPEPFLGPGEHPYSEVPSLTFFAADEEQQLEVLVVEGVPVEVRADVNGEPAAPGRVVFRHRASGLTLEQGFRDGPTGPVARRLLAPGLWEVEVAAPPAHLLIGIDHGRDALPGHQAVVDLVLDPIPTYLTWHFVTTCSVGGEVGVKGKGGVGRVTVVATLLEPGSWIDVVRERGGTDYQRVLMPVDADTTAFAAPLLHGRWRIAPEAEGLVESEPPFVDLDLSPGDERRIDFVVTLAEGDPDALRSLLVVGLGNLEPGDAGPTLVEVQPAGGGEPVARVGVEGVRAFVWGLENGDYLAVAGHRDFLEGRVEVDGFDAREVRRVHVELSRGGGLRLEASDPAGEPLPGATLDVERIDEPPELLHTDPAFRAAKLGRRLATDHSGRARLWGLYPGRHRVRVSLGEDPGTSAPLWVGRRGERLSEELVLDLTTGEEVDLVARQPPSADLRMRLECSDGWVLPEAAQVSVWDVATWDGQSFVQTPAGRQPDAPPLLQVPPTSLDGPLRDVLEVGPLPQGVFLLAVRPAGFTRTTWAYETHDPETAREVQIDLDESTGGQEVLDLGAFLVECGPAVDLVPEVASGQAPPPLATVKAQVRVFDVETGEEVGGRPVVTARTGRLEVRNLPRGPRRLAFTLSHPHFLPAPELAFEVEVELERGTWTEIAPRIEAIGGAVRVRAEGGVARLFGADPNVWIDVPVEGGEALFPSLWPGLYRVVLCADPACGEEVRRWPTVEVKAGETTSLDVGQAPPDDPGRQALLGAGTLGCQHTRGVS